MCLIVLAVNPAIAKPIFIIMDATHPGDTPHDFGYEVTAMRSGDDVTFTIDLDARASKAFESAKVIFATSTPVRVITITKDGLKHLAFTVPVAHLAHSMLEIQSDLLRDKDAKLTIYDFHGYRMALDDIPETPAPSDPLAEAHPAASPAPQPGSADSPDTQEYKEASDREKQLVAWMQDYAKTKKPPVALVQKIRDLTGKNLVAAGTVTTDGDPIIIQHGPVTYVFHYDVAKPRMEGLGVFLECTGVISYIDVDKKIVVLDHATVRWLGAD